MDCDRLCVRVWLAESVWVIDWLPLCDTLEDWLCEDVALKVSDCDFDIVPLMELVML